MALIRKLPNVDSLDFSEFWNDPKGGGVRVTGDCGESAEAAAEVCASPPIETNAQAQALMHALVDDMIAKGWAGSYTSGNVGSTNMSRLRDEAVAKWGSGAYDTASFNSFQQPLPSAALHDLLLKEAGVRPIVLEVATAGAGLHATNGSHAEAGVHYHFITVLGLYNEGYLCYDGDNSNIWNELPIYPWSAIEAATPCAVMVLNMQEGTPIPMSLNLTDTLGFFSDGGNGVWKCTKNSNTLQGGILAFYRSFGMRALFGLSYLGLPLSVELAPVAGDPARVQVFERGAVAYDPNRKLDQPPGVPASLDPSYLAHVDSGPAADFLDGAVKAQLASATAQLSSLTAALKDAQGAASKAASDLQLAQSQLSSLTSSNAALTEQVAQAQAALQPAKDALAKAQAALDAANARVATLEAQESAAGDALKALSAFAAALDAVKAVPTTPAPAPAAPTAPAE